MKTYLLPKIHLLCDLNLLHANTQVASTAAPEPDPESNSAPANPEFFDCENYLSCPQETNTLTFAILWNDTDNLNQPDGFIVNVRVEGTFGFGNHYGRPLTLPSGYSSGCAITYDGGGPLPYKLSCEIELTDIIDEWLCPNTNGNSIEVELTSIEDPDGNVYQAQDISCSCATDGCASE